VQKELKIRKIILTLVLVSFIAVLASTSYGLTSADMGKHGWMTCKTCHITDEEGALHFVNETTTTDTPSLCGQCHVDQYENWTKGLHYISKEAKCTQRWCHYFDATHHNPAIPSALAPEVASERVGLNIFGTYISYMQLISVFVLTTIAILGLVLIYYIRKQPGGRAKPKTLNN